MAGRLFHVDGGTTWTTQYNQPTAQFYHVITDNRWPYYIYGAQQDNSTIAIDSYDDDGVIGRQDWYEVGGGECGYIAPYPRDPNITFAGAGGFLSRFDKRTRATGGYFGLAAGCFRAMARRNCCTGSTGPRR